MNDTITQIQKRLFMLADPDYKDFHARLIPTVSPKRIIGVRTPELRRYAKELFSTPEADEFLLKLPHFYYEENNLHAFLIEQIKDFDLLIKELDVFLPHVDNWATCDMMRPRVFKKYPDKLLTKINQWLESGHTYKIRFALEMLMTHFLDERFSPLYLELAAEVRSNEYYVNMMQAWFFATALAKQYDAALPFICERKLSEEVHRKAIQKAIESNRITKEQKQFLRSLKRYR